MALLGYHEVEDLPIKSGDKVMIRKGTIIRTSDPSFANGVRVAIKDMLVNVNHLMPGISCHPNILNQHTAPEGWSDEKITSHVKEYYTALHSAKTPNERAAVEAAFTIHMKNPSVVWVGSGGYWAEADINEVM